MRDVTKIQYFFFKKGKILIIIIWRFFHILNFSKLILILINFKSFMISCWFDVILTSCLLLSNLISPDIKLKHYTTKAGHFQSFWFKLKIILFNIKSSLRVKSIKILLSKLLKFNNQWEVELRKTILESKYLLRFIG